MPEVKEYLKGYGFVIGQEWGEWYITKAEAGHKSIVRFNEYEYPTKLQLVMNRNITVSDVNIMLNTIEEYLAVPRIIYSASGRPYKCTASDIKLTETGVNYINISYLGFGKRVSQTDNLNSI